MGVPSIRVPALKSIQCGLRLARSLLVASLTVGAGPP